MTLAEALRRFNSPARRLPALMLMTDPVRLPDPWAAVARLPAGAGVVLRGLELGMARRLAAGCRQKRLKLVVAGDWRLAARLGAAGMHLGEVQARHAVLAPLLGWRRRRKVLLGMACHSPAALARAARLGADYALLSPVFPTASHPGAATIGAVRFAAWSRRSPVPVLALGGMNARNLRRLCGARLAGAAAIGALK